MATVSVTINGVMYPKGRSGADQPVPCTLVGQAWLSDLGVGGGPMPPGSGGGGQPPGIWGGAPIPWPTPPIYYPGPPVDPGYSPPWARPPVDPGYFPPGVGPAPPNVEIPPPGSPPVVISGGDHVTQPIVVPPAIVVNYPGIGLVLVPAPKMPTPPTTPDKPHVEPQGRRG